MLPGNRYRVHYVGWADSFDEAVSGSRIQPLSASTRDGSEVREVAPPPPPPPRFRNGDPVDVFWEGSWWHATVMGPGGDARRLPRPLHRLGPALRRERHARPHPPPALSATTYFPAPRGLGAASTCWVLRPG